MEIPNQGEESPGRGVPPPEQLQDIADAIRYQKRPLEPAVIPPPQQGVALLAELADVLYRRELLLNRDCCDIFLTDRAATFALPGPGVLYQAVGLVPLPDVDALLQESAGWGQRGLLVGGLLHYRPSSSQDASLMPRGVVLRRQGQELYYEIYDHTAEPVHRGRWRLRDIRGYAEKPYSFITAREISFSQAGFQGSVITREDGGPETEPQRIAASAAGLLKSQGLLPEDAWINVAGALAGIEGTQAAAECSQYLSEASEACQPNIVVAAAVPTAEPATRMIAKERENRLGIGVAQVLHTIEHQLVDADGNEAWLEPGSYRLDLLQAPDDSRLIRFVAASDAGQFYGPARLGDIQGVPVDPDTLEPQPDGDPQVLMDAMSVTVCTNQASPTPCSVGGVSEIFRNQKTVQLFQ